LITSVRELSSQLDRLDEAAAAQCVMVGWAPVPDPCVMVAWLPG
jgi:hypothetical protein